MFFHSFEDGNANTISSFKWWKIFKLTNKKRAPLRLIYLISQAPVKKLFKSISTLNLFGLKLSEKHIYRVSAAQPFHANQDYSRF